MIATNEARLLSDGSLTITVADVDDDECSRGFQGIIAAGKIRATGSLTSIVTRDEVSQAGRDPCTTWHSSPLGDGFVMPDLALRPIGSNDYAVSYT